MELMRRSGLSASLSGILRPLLYRLFPSARRNAPLLNDLSHNLSANLLGLGNAATPAGIRAATQLRLGEGPASDELCRLVVMNTASVQLLPTTVAAVRAAAGAQSAFDILPAVWLSSLFSVAVGLSCAALFAALSR
jgi:spore maturation protein A